jgi:2-hydroxychromene-2-carboxylate isomerase
VDDLGFWFDYSCPYAFLASTRLAALERDHDIRVDVRPMLLGGVFRAREVPQNLAGTLLPSKARHLAHDLARWADALGTSLSMPAGHPFRTVEALRATLATGLDRRIIDGFYRAYWQEGRPPSEPSTLRDVLTEAGYDADAVLADLDAPRWRDDLRARTDRAISLGIFGAPTWQTPDGRLFWGQDRVDFALRAMGKSPLPLSSPRAPKAATELPATDVSPRQTESNMAHTLELYWDFSSPYAYLGVTQAEALAARTGATLVDRPMLLGAVFKAIGQSSIPMETYSEAKRAYTLRDMHDWAAHWGVPFSFNATFPLNSIKALRVYLALPEERRKGFRDATFRAAWAEGRDIGDEAVLRALIGDDAEAVLAKTLDPEVKQALFAATDRAVAAGVFGAPAWVVDGDQLFFGQDRLPLVERALTA